MQIEHIFVIDDDKFFAKYFIKKFELLVKENVEFHHYTDLRPVFTANASIIPSLIFLDNLLTEEGGLDSIPELCERYPASDIILISANESKEQTTKALESGASRFISKDDLLMKNIADLLNENLIGPTQVNLLGKLLKPKS